MSEKNKIHSVNEILRNLPHEEEYRYFMNSLFSENKQDFRMFAIEKINAFEWTIHNLGPIETGGISYLRCALETKYFLKQLCQQGLHITADPLSSADHFKVSAGEKMVYKRGFNYPAESVHYVEIATFCHQPLRFINRQLALKFLQEDVPHWGFSEMIPRKVRAQLYEKIISKMDENPEVFGLPEFHEELSAKNFQLKCCQ